MNYTNRVTVTFTKDAASIATGSSRGWYSGPGIAFGAHPDSLTQILDHSFALRFDKSKLIAQHDQTTMVIATRIPNG